MVGDKNEKTTTQPLHIGGIGLPMIDFIAPSHEELAKGAALINEGLYTPIPSYEGWNNKKALEEMKREGPGRVERAQKALTDFEAFLQDKGYTPPKKLFLKAEEDAQVANWFGEMIDAAVLINRAARFVGKPTEQLHIRCMGGTIANKMHAVQTAMGDNVQTHMLGMLGDEDINANRERALSELQESGIDFQQMKGGVSLGNMAIGYILQKNGDRVALKSYIPPLDTLLNAEHQEQIRTFADTPPLDMYLVEGGDFGPKKFGDAAFKAFEERALASGKPIMLGLPTETSLILGKGADIETNRERVFRLIDAPNTTFIGANESEAVAMFCNEQYEEIKPTTENPKPLVRNHPQVLKALDLIQERLKQKVAALPEGAVEPVVFVSVGPEGAFAVTATNRVFREGEIQEHVANNIGAGDALFGGSLAHYIKTVLRPKDGSPAPTRFTDEDLTKLLECGQKVACAAVGQKGAQLPADQMKALVHGDVPLVGTSMAPPEALNDKSKGVAK